MRSLPDSTDAGLLPPGDYPLTLEGLRQSFLVCGPRSGYPTWDTGWRLRLVENLAILARQLWDVGVSRIFVDGSFVEDKDHPNDIDGYFECGLAELASGELQVALNALDPFKVWTWDPMTRRPYRGYPKLQLPMGHRYRVELYPHYGFGPPSGIRDKYGNDLLFPAAFRLSRRGDEPHGIVRILGDK